MQGKCPLETKNRVNNLKPISRNIFSKTMITFNLTPTNTTSERTPSNNNEKRAKNINIFETKRILKLSSPRNSKPTLIIKKRSKTPVSTSHVANHGSANKDENAKDPIDFYDFGKVLGIGSYAVVKEALHIPSQARYAAKIYEKSKLVDPHKKRNVKKEIMIMQTLNHPFIIKMKEFIDTKSQIYIIMEYVGGMSLHRYLKALPNRRVNECEGRRIFGQILSAIDYCHALFIAHRDIKLENIMIDKSNNVKLIDFGFSTYTSSDKKNTVFCGTPSYMAPEIVARREYYGRSADIWALGVLLYVLLCGNYPFRGKSDQEVYKNILIGNFEEPTGISFFAKSLIRKILQTDWNKRPTCSQIRDDPWMKFSGVLQSSNSHIDLDKCEHNAPKSIKGRENKEN
ncbi:unnamed protein product [Blepharisma stoltei]|uniref:Protein kinase domain-containing protein n=1 Tax=Blepharisma stoltei TaxID=1481888 RepID=A0AAU9ITP6_9CILI|nr:unnamed protein product [Blepharisma stoltei]